MVRFNHRKVYLLVVGPGGPFLSLATGRTASAVSRFTYRSAWVPLHWLVLSRLLFHLVKTLSVWLKYSVIAERPSSVRVAVVSGFLFTNRFCNRTSPASSSRSRWVLKLPSVMPVMRLSRAKLLSPRGSSAARMERRLG